jgi:ribosomal protein S18 acetylase RimI-like enzyme
MTSYIIGQELNKNNQSMVVKYAAAIGGTTVLPFFLKNFAILIEQGYSHSLMAGTNSSQAVYVEIDDKVVGHIVFEIIKDGYNTAWIVLSCVDKNYRNLGIYNIMHKHFEMQIKKLGSTKIASHVHVNNKARLASCKSVGMEPTFYRMEKTI